MTETTSADRTIAPEDVLKFRCPMDLAASPDGRRVAFRVQVVDARRDRYRSRIWLADRESGRAWPITAGPNDACPRWSPDGRRLAFLSDRGEGGPQVYVMPVDGGEAVAVSRGLKGASALEWSPDGTRIAVLAQATWPQADDELLKAVAWRPEEGEGDREDGAAAGETGAADESQKVRVTQRLQYRFDAMGYHDDHRRHLFTVPVPADLAAEPAPARQLTEGAFDVSAFSWRPGSDRISFLANLDEDADRSWRKDIFEVAVDADGGARGEPRRIAHGQGALWSLAWSPDGTRLAVIGNDGKHQHATQNSLWIYTDGGGFHDVTPSFDQGVGSELVGDIGGFGLPAARWSQDGRVIFASVHGGRSRIYAATLDGARPAGEARVEELAPQVEGSAGMLAPAADAVFFVGQDFHRPPEVYVVPAAASDDAGAVAQPRRLTHLNDDVVARMPLGETRHMTWRSTDGWEIEGWITLPPDFDPSAKYPLVLHVHGGPHGAFGHAFHFAHHWHAAAGRVVLFTNPRGSSGYGQEFEAACVGDWGGMDYQDIMSGVDAVIAQGYVDERRMTVTGISYGGYMTSWIITHTDRFACAIPEMLVSNLVSFYGTADIGTHFLEFEIPGAPWEGVENLWDHSPMKYVQNCVTPTLIIEGEADYRCPIEQGEQLYTSLLRRGVDAALARFPGASHAFSMTGVPSQRVQRLRLIDAWIRKYTGARAT